jgi:hypothetical protein
MTNKCSGGIARIDVPQSAVGGLVIGGNHSNPFPATDALE